MISYHKIPVTTKSGQALLAICKRKDHVFNEMRNFAKRHGFVLCITSDSLNGYGDILGLCGPMVHCDTDSWIPVDTVGQRKVPYYTPNVDTAAGDMAMRDMISIPTITWGEYMNDIRAACTNPPMCINTTINLVDGGKYITIAGTTLGTDPVAEGSVEILCSEYRRLAFT